MRIENRTKAPLEVHEIGAESDVDEAGNRRVTKKGLTLRWGSGDPEVQKRLEEAREKAGVPLPTNIVEVDGRTWPTIKKHPAVARLLRSGDLVELG
jgi:hypothetical protein